MSGFFINGDPNKNIIPVFQPSIQKDVIVSSGAGVTVDNLSDIEKYHYRISRQEYIPLDVSLEMDVYISSVLQALPIIRGRVVDEIRFNFLKNKSVVSQTLTNDASITPPSLLPSDNSFIYTGLSVTNNVLFTYTADDGEGQSESVQSAQKLVRFGNWIYLLHGGSKINVSVSTLISFITSATTKIAASSRSIAFYATGGFNEKHFVAVPAAYGLCTFRKGLLDGGYVRLKNIDGTITVSGGTESPILITNEFGHTEAYHVYESLYDNQNDPAVPIIIL